MWYYFDSTGALVESGLQHGPAARAGTTNFQIFAYFDGVDLTSNNFATVKLIKPDFNDSSYPLLAMRKVVMKYEKMPGENSNYFKEDGGPNNDGNYPGFLFDFSNFSGDQNVAILLDTPGLWQAIITLYNANQVMSTQGAATFNVQFGNIVNDGTEISIDELMAAYSAAISSKLDYINAIVTVDNISLTRVENYNEGQVIYDKTTKILYQKDNDEWAPKVKLAEDKILYFHSWPNYEDYPLGQVIFYSNGADKKFCTRVSNGWEDTFVLSNYYTKGEIDSTFANYDTTSEVNAKLSNYYTKASMNEMFSYLSASIAEKSRVIGEANSQGNLRKLTITNSGVSTTYNVEGGGSVDDVLVDGRSVVDENGIANIEQTDCFIVPYNIFENTDSALQQTKTYVFDSFEDLPTTVSDFNSYFGTTISDDSTGSFAVIVGIIYQNTSSPWGYQHYIVFGNYVMGDITYSQYPYKCSIKRFYGYAPTSPTGQYIKKLYKCSLDSESISANPTVEQRTKDPFNPYEYFINFDDTELFYCIYGSTTYAEITQALSAGKLPVCFYNDIEYVYVGLSNTNRYTFSSQLFDSNRYISVNSSDSWGYGSNNFEVVNNKVTSLSSSSTNAQYPSAKAVYDKFTTAATETNNAITTAIEALDVSDITANLSAAKTITALSETDGKISATASAIAIAETQVSGLVSDLSGLDGRLDTIEPLIPAQATSSNKLADKNFVNSSIATNTAYFLGTLNLVTQLGLTTSATHSQIASAIADYLGNQGTTWTNNDYVFVAYPDATVPTEYTQFDRYKYSTNSDWEYEYTLNNSSFTAEQWAAISSGITSTKVTSYDNHLANTSNPHSVTATQVGLGSVVNTGDSATPVSGGTTKFTTGGAYTELAKKVDTTRKINNKALSSDITLTASDVSALASSTKYGYSLSVSGTSVSLKDQDGTVLSTIATQDTTYSVLAAVQNGTSASLCSTGEKYTWNHKMDSPITTMGDMIIASSSGGPARLPIGTAGQVLTVKNFTQGQTYPSWENPVASEISYLTTAPSSANTSGNLKVVVLSSEPATKYDGYIYIITGSNS